MTVVAVVVAPFLRGDHHCDVVWWSMWSELGRATRDVVWWSELDGAARDVVDVVDVAARSVRWSELSNMQSRGIA